MATSAGRPSPASASSDSQRAQASAVVRPIETGSSAARPRVAGSRPEAAHTALASLASASISSSVPATSDGVVGRPNRRGERGPELGLERDRRHWPVRFRPLAAQSRDVALERDRTEPPQPQPDLQPTGQLLLQGPSHAGHIVRRPGCRGQHQRRPGHAGPSAPPGTGRGARRSVAGRRSRGCTSLTQRAPIPARSPMRATSTSRSRAASGLRTRLSRRRRPAGARVGRGWSIRSS